LDRWTKSQPSGETYIVYTRNVTFALFHPSFITAFYNLLFTYNRNFTFSHQKISKWYTFFSLVDLFKTQTMKTPISNNSILSRSTFYGVFGVIQKHVFILKHTQKNKSYDITKKKTNQFQMGLKPLSNPFSFLSSFKKKRFKNEKKTEHQWVNWMNYYKNICKNICKSTGRHNAMPCSIQSKSRSRYHTLIFSLCTIFYFFLSEFLFCVSFMYLPFLCYCCKLTRCFVIFFKKDFVWKIKYKK